MRSFVTKDEMCVHHFTPETKQQLALYQISVVSTKNIMPSVFWGAKRILFIEYLKKGNLPLEECKEILWKSYEN